MTKQDRTPYQREVAEMPQALGNLAAFYRKEGWPLLERWAADAGSSRRIRFSGMGTSEFAPLLITGGLARAGLDASAHDAGELLHYPQPGAGLTVLISQSGESVETRRLAEAPPFAGPVGAIVNNPDSTVARRASWFLPMCAGHETAISTKTYLNTLGVLHLMAEALAGKAAVEAALDELARLSEAVERVPEDALETAAARLKDTQALHWVARGPAMAAAHQAELTFMEGSRMTCRAFTGGAFRHGPVELAGEGHRCVMLIPGGKTEALLTGMAREFAGYGSTVVVITDRELDLPASCTALRVPCFGERLFPLAASVTQARLLDAVARARGLQAGDFRRTQKITAQE